MRDSLAAIAAVLAFYAVAAVPVFAGLVVLPVEWWEGQNAIVLQTCVLFVGSVAASSLFLGLGWADVSMLGFRTAERSLRGFGVGTVVGVVMAAAAVGTAVVFGGARFTFVSDPLSSYLLSAAKVGAVLLFAAFTEELLFRGYPISRLALTVGKVRASVALATVFMLAHALNPDASVFGLVNIGIAALVLSAAFFGPGGLAAAWGLHVGWNGGLGIVADAPVSGVDFEMPIIEFTTGGPAWFTGGSFGPEGGLVSTIAMGAVLVWLLRNERNLGEDKSK
jgi:membrane protease YdiL (CAAX protease family)